MDDLKPLDPASLKALAHPLRVELFRALMEEPATASQLAERFGETSASTSYHLRQLARFGFIEDDPDRGNRRDRWWRAAVRGTSLDVRTEGIADDPPTAELARWFIRDILRRQWERAQQFVDNSERWGLDWSDATTFSDISAELTWQQLRDLRDELHAVIERHRVEPGQNPDAQARPVRITVHTFPEGDPSPATS